jgi:alkylhydroperoxidase family enzyme
MADIEGLRKAVVERALEGPGKAAPEQRRAAFANQGVAPAVRTLIDKVTNHAYKVTDEDVAAAKAAGVSEDEIFELAVCASLGQATRQLEAALAALDAAIGKKE